MASRQQKPETKDANATVAQQLLGYLRLEGVPYIFGVPGGYLAPILDEIRLRSDEIDYIVTRHECGATYMADGYFRVTGKLGVAMVTSGVGGTNALTGAMNAHGCNSRTMLITGEVPQQLFGKGALQEGIDGVVNIKAIHRNAVQYSGVVSSPDNFHTLFRQALRQSLTTPGNTTHISIPINILKEVPSEGNAVPDTAEAYRARSEPSSPERVEKVFELLTQAQKPLIYLGNGCRQALADPDRLTRFQQFTERFGIPVMTTPHAKGIFPESHPMSLRNFGTSQSEWPRRYMGVEDGYEPFDCLLIIGSSMRQWATSSWTKALYPNGPLIQIDSDYRMIGRTYSLDMGVVGDAAAVIDHLSALGQAAKPNAQAAYARRARVQEVKEALPPYEKADRRQSEASPIKPQRLLQICEEEFPRDTQIFLDAGNCTGWTLHHLTVDPPTAIHSTQYIGPMGFGVAAVIGAKMGAPEKPNICITGDGAFLMHGTEVSTAAANGVGAIWIIFYDNELRMNTLLNRTFYPAGDQEPPWQNQYKLGQPDLPAVARGLGAEAYDVAAPADFREALQAAVHRADQWRQPQVIVCHIDTEEFPPYWNVTLP